VAHPSREEADVNGHALHADPEFLTYRKAAERLIEKVNDDYTVGEGYESTDFSAMK